MPAILRIILGWFFIFLGVIGLFLPVLQGLLFLAIGALLLSKDIPLFKRFVSWIHLKFPAMRGPIKKWRIQLGEDRKKSSPGRSHDSPVGK